MSTPINSTERQVATFYVDNLLLGVEIQKVREINRHHTITEVPHAPDFVRGVINLRGEVVTVVDMRCALGLPPSDSIENSRTVIIHSQDEVIGLVVDRIADIYQLNVDEIVAPPANVGSVDAQVFEGVWTMDDRIIVLLDVEAVLASEAATA